MEAEAAVGVLRTYISEAGLPSETAMMLDRLGHSLREHKMGRNKSGEWKLRNVIIETVNLGEIYRNQFQAAARKHDGDLNTVIANWGGIEVDS